MPSVRLGGDIGLGNDEDGKTSVEAERPEQGKVTFAPGGTEKM
jgi:hypothetical protein